MKTLLVILVSIICGIGVASAQITASVTGNWSVGGTWVGGVVPTAADDVVIPTGKTVTIDIVNAECRDLSVAGNLYFALTTGLGIVVNGNASLTGTGRFRLASATPGSGQYYQTIELKKDLSVVSGCTFDMRQASGAIGAVGRVVFSGNANSTVSLSLTTYTSATEEFNSVVINKTGGAKVILNSGTMYLSNNSTNFPDTLIFVSGVVETGANALVQLATASANISGGSSTSYVHGILGRGVSNSATNTTKDFYVGDGTQYRPLSLHFDAPTNLTGHYVWVRLLSGDANTGSSVLNGGINKVSVVRYYEIGYLQNAGSAAAMDIDRFAPSYGNDDGVVPDHTDLRVAYSTDSRATWNAMVQTSPHTTDLTSPPTTITPDTLATAITVNTGTSVFATIANISGGANPLPVELQSFIARSVRRSVELVWSTATETNNAGFTIERKSVDNWVSVGFVQGAGTSNAPRSYSFVDNTPETGRLQYRLKQTDRDGAIQYSKTVEVTLAAAPAVLSLNGNYPNPFNPTTNIRFVVPSAGRAVVKVFNILGKEVATVFDAVAVPGQQYTVPFNAASLPSGIYFSQLDFAGKRLTQKMLLMK